MNTYKSGKWNAICDRCGFKFKSSELKKDWQGLMVCHRDFEPRNQQDFIRVRPERVTPPWVRPEPPDQFIFTCDLWSSQGKADFGTADCARVGFETPIEFLIQFFEPSAITECAISGRCIAGVSEFNC